MKMYEVKNGVATFGIGMILALSKEQADVRQHSLGVKGKYFVVNQPISFKAGEKIGVIAGTVSKRLLEGLKNLNEKEETPPINDETFEFPKIKHVGFGNYEVFGKDGTKLTDKPIPKVDAEKLLEKAKEE